MNIDDKKIEEICVNVLGDIVKVKAEKKVREERYYGIQAFDNVEDAWYVMAGEFSGQCEGLGDGRLFILDDETFETIIFERAVIAYCECKLGKITKEQLKYRLRLGNGQYSDYLLDFNFFHRSEYTGKYYTSRMEYRDDGRYRWDKRQWNIYDELYKIHDFRGLVKAAKRMYEEVEYELEESGEDAMGYINDLLLNMRPYLSRGFKGL